MNIDREATNQEVDLALLIIERQIEEDKMSQIRRDMEFCRLAAQDYKRRKLRPAPKVNQISNRVLILITGLSATIVISTLYLIARLL